MKLVIIFGKPAVGKMTVGQELMKITGLRLFHNHMTIDLVSEVFGSYNGKALKKIRDIIFTEFAKSNNEGMIFTGVWYLDHQEDWDYIKYICEIITNDESELFFVELVAPQEIRFQRNVSENRLLHKPSKRDIEHSNQAFLNNDKKGRCESYDGEIKSENFVKIDNSDLSPDVVAKMIKERFSL